MDGALGAASPAPLARADVWLLRPPSAAVEAAVWAPVCAMALDAMEHGRAVLWARLAGGAGTAVAQDTAVLAGARQAAVGAAGRLAAARFWSSVEEFAHHAAAVGAFEGLGADHPFLCRRAGRVEALLPTPAQPLTGSPA